MDIDDFEIYQKAMRIGDVIREEAVRWDYFARDTVGKQLVRCAGSIASNLSEGFGRYQYAGNKNFRRYSRGSLDETMTFLTKAKKRDLVSSEKVNQLLEELVTLRKRINACIRSIGDKGTP